MSPAAFGMISLGFCSACNRVLLSRSYRTVRYIRPSWVKAARDAGTLCSTKPRTSQTPFLSPDVPAAAAPAPLRAPSSLATDRLPVPPRHGLVPHRWLCSSTHCKPERPRVQSTIDEEEIRRFSALAQLWWDESGEFEALHSMNRIRVPLIRDAFSKSSRERGTKPLAGLKILDVGCGGGILAEPLARLGADVVGVDASEDNISIAQTHLKHEQNIAPNIKYIVCTVEDMVATDEGKFDAVVASEVLEHVADLEMFVRICCKLVKPGGSIFFTTINKTFWSYSLGIIAAERLFNLLPSGTHDWNKFVSPVDLQYLLDQNGFTTRILHGLWYNPLTKSWSWTHRTDINYALQAMKETSAT